MSVEEETRAIAAPGGRRLEGRLRRPREGARAGVVVLHPHPLEGGDMENHLVKGLADEVGKRGFAVLRFNFRHALTRDAVDPAALVADSDRDVAAAVANLRTALPEGAPVGLAGYSFGAVVALRNAAALEAAAVACVGVPAKGRTGVARAVDWGALTASGVPVLVLQGQYDEVGTPDDVRAVAADAGARFDVRPVPDASHGYFGEAGFVARIASGFLAKRLAP